MATGSPDKKIELTIQLPQHLAVRLKLAAATQKRAASEVVVGLLDRHLPHLEAGKKKKTGNIPYA